MRKFCTNRLKRSLSNPRTSGTWPDFATKLSIAINSDEPASDEVLNYYLKGILKAQSRIYDVCKETDLLYAPNLSKMFRNKIYLKREDQQPVFSFKLRGSYNKIASLTDREKENGIATCSAGNHAQGVAFSASRLGLDNLIVMPEGTPRIKVDAVKKFGGNVLLSGKNFDEAQNEALKHCERTGMTLIHPFDDYHVICGQGTIGIEILKQIPSVSTPYAVFSCVGGAGLIAGVGCYIKQLSPDTKIIGSEAADANALTHSLIEKKRIFLDEVGLFADGAAVKIPGKNCFSLAERVVDEMINVSTDDICQAIKLIFNDTRSLVEPAGALSVAALVKYLETNDIENETLVAVLSGANMDFDRLRFVSERADRSESLIHVKIPEKEGSFFKLYENIYPRNVTEFSYRMKNGSTADILLSFQAASSEDKDKVLSDLRENNLEVVDFSSNEIAKTHIRHFSGGRHAVKDERLLSFEFPEGPGALFRFLGKLYHVSEDRPSYNISLFHYRNHGDDVGRVLVGVQVSPDQEEKFTSFLDALGFVYTEETQNPAYLHFLTNVD